MLVTLLIIITSLGTTQMPLQMDEPSMPAPSPSPWQLRLEMPLTLVTTPAPTGTGAAIAVWPGLRVGLERPLIDDAPWFWGGDLAIVGTVASIGNGELSFTRLIAGIEARVMAGAAVRSAIARLGGYGFGGALLAPGLRLTSSSERAVLPTVAAGARVGIGGVIQLLRVHLRLELGVGVREVGFEETASMSIGFAL